VGKNIIKHRPYKNYAEFANKVMEKYSGMNSRMLDSVNKVGAAEFYDNPLSGNERDHYFELLHIPAFSYKNVPGAAGAVVTKLIDYDEMEASVVIGVVSAIKRGNGWSKIDILDETGTATIFGGEHTPVEDGKMYAMLVANKSLIKFIEVENIGPDEGMLCSLLYGNVKPAPEGRYRVIALHERMTKAGKKMGTLILMDEDGTLGWAIVFPAQYERSFMYLTDDKIVNLELRQKDDGTIIMHKVVDTHGW
jgi:DNA polymerase III alpha subunit